MEYLIMIHKIGEEAYNDYQIKVYSKITNNKELAENIKTKLESVPAETLVRQGALSAGVACGRCDGCGNEKTYENQACMPINGKVRCIDWCIHQIVASLNAGGVETVACCCGHGEHVGRIDLADGRILFISKPSA